MPDEATPDLWELSRQIRDYGHNPRHIERLYSAPFDWHLPHAPHALYAALKRRSSTRTLRGAEAPLFHSGAGSIEFFRGLGSGALPVCA